MRKVYIAGPMRGYPQFNFPAFFKAEKRLRYYDGDITTGFDEIFNPARADDEHHEVSPSVMSPDGDLGEATQKGFSLREALHRDMVYLTDHATHIYMLKGWEKSAGATAEHALAVALGLEIIYE